MNWKKTIKIKCFLTESEDYVDVQEAMNKVADILNEHIEFQQTSIIQKLRKIPKGDDIITPVDYANKLLGKVYDIADEEKIWIE